jgi:hypothetical protein
MGVTRPLSIGCLRSFNVTLTVQNCAMMEGDSFFALHFNAVDGESAGYQ